MYLVKVLKWCREGLPPVYGEMEDPVHYRSGLFVYFYDRPYDRWIGQFFDLSDLELVGVLT